MKNKRGDKYYIMISLILGLIVLSLSLYFIFQEFFNEDMISQESCRQSVILRGTLPDAQIAKLTPTSFKDDFPLKCKTQVVEISKGDIVNENAGKIIADTLVECWYLYGNGDFNPMPAKFFDIATTCVPCARIRLTNEAKQYMIDNESIKIDIEAAIRVGIFYETTYYNYLRDIGESFPALSFAGGMDFNLSGNGFSVGDKKNKYTLINRENGETITENLHSITLPQYFNASQGDLLINYGDFTFITNDDYGQYTPYLFYFQIDQQSDPFSESYKKFLERTIHYSRFCFAWDGIPA